MSFVDKNQPKKQALGSNPPELLCLWQKSQRPQKRSIIMFASQPWNEMKCAIETDFSIILLRSDF